MVMQLVSKTLSLLSIMMVCSIRQKSRMMQENQQNITMYFYWKILKSMQNLAKNSPYKHLIMMLDHVTFSDQLIQRRFNQCVSMKLLIINKWTFSKILKRLAISYLNHAMFIRNQIHHQIQN